MICGRNRIAVNRTDSFGLILCIAIIALAVTIFLATFIDAVYNAKGTVFAGLSEGRVNIASISLVLAIYGMLLALILLLRSHFCKLIDSVLKYRYAICAIVLFLMTALRISGSSVSMWASILGEDAPQGVIFGIPRLFRSDEWMVLTPFMSSQSFNSGFLPISDILRACPTDVTMVYALPAYSPATIFRPTLWAFLILDFEHALAFFWNVRIVGMLLVTYELFMLITNNRYVSLSSSLLITFSPIVQWWFAVNGIAEIFIYGQLLVLLLNRMLSESGTKRAYVPAFLLPWIAGCYAFVLYPAWQVPFVYVFGAMGVWTIWRWYKSSDHGQIRSRIKRCALPLIASTIVFAFIAILALQYSRETISAVRGTVYPGSRTDSGGGGIEHILFPFLAASSPIKSMDYYPNVCSAASYISLFPISTIVSMLICLKKKDKLGLILSVVIAVFAIYRFCGIPSLFARLSLLGLTTTNRLRLADGYLDIAITMRALTYLGETDWHFWRPSLKCAILTSASVSLLICIVVRIANPNIMDKVQLALCFLTFLALLFILISSAACFGGDKRGRDKALLAFSIYVAIIGVAVNPIQQGTSALTNSDFSQTVRQISSDNPESVWMSDSNQIANALVANGCRTINCTNTYPALSRWHMLDTERRYEEVYNRYAHISVLLDNSTFFQLLHNDHFLLHISLDDVKKLRPDYWISSLALDEMSSDEMVFLPIRSFGDYTLYSISYK